MKRCCLYAVLLLAFSNSISADLWIHLHNGKIERVAVAPSQIDRIEFFGPAGKTLDELVIVHRNGKRQQLNIAPAKVRSMSFFSQNNTSSLGGQQSLKTPSQRSPDYRQKPLTTPVSSSFSNTSSSSRDQSATGSSVMPGGTVYRVGPGKRYSVPSEVARLVKPGDTVEIAAGDYLGDVAIWRTSHITLRGVGGRAHLRAEGKAAGRKATWVINGSNVRVENIEFSGSRVRDLNGAGIRAEGTNLTIINCIFRDNQMGILSSSNPNSEILIDSSEFYNNTVDYHKTGRLGHNIYIGRIKKFTLKNSYIHDAHIGHNVKSRATENYILYNRISDGRGGSSYLIDLSEGGNGVVLGNVLLQASHADNTGLIAYAPEGNRERQDQYLYVVNNTMINEAGNGVFVRNLSQVPVKMINNLLVGIGQPAIGPSQQKNNLAVRRWPFVDPTRGDYRLLRTASAVGRGVFPGSTPSGFSLLPLYEYNYPNPLRERGGTLDIGAFGMIQ